MVVEFHERIVVMDACNCTRLKMMMLGSHGSICMQLLVCVYIKKERVRKVLNLTAGGS